MNECILCKSKTNNPKFCSRTCAAKFNNAANPKRKLTKKCADCGCAVTSTLSFCKRCREKNSIQNKPISYFDTKKYAGSNKYGSIRFWARKNAECIENKCANCGYDKHVEVCHIVGISEHDKSDLVSYVNRIDNLVKLCPNCHWEFDNGILDIGGKGGS